MNLYFCLMKIKLLCVGKSGNAALQHLIGEYEKRLRFYIPFEREILPDTKRTGGTDNQRQKESEGRAILKRLKPGDVPVLLDERGKSYTSAGFSVYLQKKMNAGIKRLVFVTGGAYGFSGEVYEKAQETISLSKMTFPHQLVRLFFMEQLYRAFTILNNEPYHHN